MKYFKDIRLAFWEAHPEFKDEYRKTWKQNQYKTDIRCAFCDFIDHLRRDGVISESIAERITL